MIGPIRAARLFLSILLWLVALTAAAVFGYLLLWGTCAGLVSGTRRTRFGASSWAICASVALRIAGIRVVGPPVRPVAPALIVANHRSWLDAFVLAAVHPTGFAAKTKFQKWPLVGFFWGAFGPVGVEPGISGVRDFTHGVQQKLKEGISVVVFPEGYTTEPGRIRRFSASAFTIVNEIPVDLYAVAIDYLNSDAQPCHSWCGDESLIANIVRLSRTGEMTAILKCERLVTTSLDCRHIRDAAHQAISRMLGLSGDAEDHTLRVNTDDKRPLDVPLGQLGFDSLDLIELETETGLNLAFLSVEEHGDITLRNIMRALTADHCEIASAGRSNVDRMVVEWATTADQREDIYSLRYTVYVDEMHRRQPHADYSNRRIEEPWDASGRLLRALIDGVVIGTVRVNVASEIELDHYADWYGLRELGDHNSSQVALVTKLIVTRSHRFGSVALALFRECYKTGLEHGIEIAVIDCNHHLKSLYERIGFRQVLPNFVHPLYGSVHPMHLVLRDIQHLRRVHSPLLDIAERWVRDHNFADDERLPVTATPVWDASRRTWRGLTGSHVTHDGCNCLR